MLIDRSTHTKSQYKQEGIPVTLVAIVPLGQTSVHDEENRQKPAMHKVQGVGFPLHKEQFMLQGKQMLGPVELNVYP